jgi:hypothetical protein
MLDKIILNISKGYSEVLYNNRKYGVTRVDFNDGKSLKTFAQELGGTDFISFNYYITKKKSYLKPCEMPEEKVRDFLLNCSFIK